MDINLFDFNLPEELIAQSPLKQRENCKLLVINKKDKITADRHFFDILEYLKSKNYKLYATTNGLCVTQYRRIKESGLEPYFDKVFVSEDAHHQKPEKEYFDFEDKFIKGIVSLMFSQLMIKILGVVYNIYLNPGATFEFVEGNYVAEPIDVTDKLGTEELYNYQTMLVEFKGLTVVGTIPIKHNLNINPITK